MWDRAALSSETGRAAHASLICIKDWQSGAA